MYQEEYQSVMNRIGYKNSKKQETWEKITKEYQRRLHTKADIQEEIIFKRRKKDKLLWIPIATGSLAIVIILAVLTNEILTRMPDRITESLSIKSTIYQDLNIKSELLNPLYLEKSKVIITQVDKNDIIVMLEGKLSGKFIIPMFDTGKYYVGDKFDVDYEFDGSLIHVDLKIDEDIFKLGNYYVLGADFVINEEYSYIEDVTLDINANQPDEYGVVNQNEIPDQMEPGSIIQFFDESHYLILEGGAYNYTPNTLLEKYKNLEKTRRECRENNYTYTEKDKPTEGLRVTYGNDGGMYHFYYELSLEGMKLDGHDLLWQRPFSTLAIGEIIKYHEGKLQQKGEWTVAKEPDDRGYYWHRLDYPGISYLTFSTVDTLNEESLVYFFILTDSTYKTKWGVYVGLEEEKLRKQNFVLAKYTLETNEISLYFNSEVDALSENYLKSYLSRVDAGILPEKFDTIYYSADMIPEGQMRQLKEQYSSISGNSTIGLAIFVSEGKVVEIVNDWPTAD
ncbi:hypothetical protein [Lachnoclostridium phytofermentans]|uniref:Uncharacterized protein n=1 Tax=Lachnoclostridium phytofermentans (strain ATCC 700394 / DSM 18823 / ISDg) TaxID=357809 RepID=A9KMM0_LACP7|nr:hypothetical protein [Lachnoclostridium phytofermentans]ABX41465.1 hypothetical protein Cphy_1087 [Lachnoclostridium phytofermentans ISDg]